jgi:predicted CXXCH cytochrome family protein
MKKIALVSYISFLLAIYASVALADEECIMCHADKEKGVSIHQAVKMGCKVCHIGVEDTDVPHTILGSSKGLPAEGSMLCFSCHERGMFEGQRVVHTPVAAEMCSACHDPHSSSLASLLRSDKVCLNCHDEKGLSSKRVVHAPVARGMCMECHDPHQSDNEKLLLRRDSEQCGSCHDIKAFTGASVHLPVALGMCTSCHDPHQSDYDALATTEGLALCLDCHDRKAISGRDSHRPVESVQCMGCHDPHAGNKALLISK